jgi:hypothetical protein
MYGGVARVVPFESFRAEIEAAVLTPVSEKKSPAGRKPIGRDTALAPSLRSIHFASGIDWP